MFVIFLFTPPPPWPWDLAGFEWFAEGGELLTLPREGWGEGDGPQRRQGTCPCEAGLRPPPASSPALSARDFQDGPPSLGAPPVIPRSLGICVCVCVFLTTRCL